METPRRQAERVRERLEASAWTPAWPRRLALLPNYLGQHVLLSASRAACWASRSACRWRWPPAATPRCAGRRCSWRRPGPDHPQPGAAGALLSAAAGALGAEPQVSWASASGAGLPALAAGADALFDAADPAERRRPASLGVDPAVGRGRQGRRHDRPPAPAPGRAAAGRAGDHGRHPHRGGLDHRRGDAVDAGRPDLARRLHLLRPADRGLGARAVRLRGRGGPGAHRRPAARPDRGGRGAARPPARHRRRGRSCRWARSRRSRRSRTAPGPASA